MKALTFTQSPEQLESLIRGLQTLLDTSRDCVLFVDKTGRILAANRAVEDMFGHSEIELYDRSITQLLPAGLDGHLSGVPTDPGKRIMLEGRSFDGQTLPLAASLVPLDGCEAFGLVLREAPLRFDVNVPPPLADSFGLDASSKPAFAPAVSERASSTGRNHAREAEALELMFNISSVANEATTLEQALAIALELVCHHFGWHLAHACLVDHSAQPTVHSTELWFGNFSPAYASIRRERPADGLTGMALAARCPQLLTALDAPERERQAFPADHALGVAFPVNNHGRVLAIIEAYSLDATTIQPSALAMLQLIGSQLGQVAERERREKELRAALEQAESAARQKSEFLSNMSHEFRTPMHATINYANLAQRALERGDPERARRSLSAIQVSGKRLLTLLNDILDLARMEAGRFTCNIVQASFGAVIERAITEVEALASAKSIRLARHLDHQEDLCFDEARVAQVLVNLLSNAIKFSPAATVIELRTQDDQLNGKPAVSCHIEDQGLGIPDSELETIFDKFEQSRRTKSGSGGTGLGLAICRQILAAHHGVIFAQNRPQGGAVFTFCIPRGGPDHPDSERKDA